MFLTANDFNLLPYNIPNADKVANTLPDYISAKEEKALVDLIGRQFYNDLIAGIVSDWVNTSATVINQEYAYGLNVWKALTVQTGTAPVEGSDWTLVRENDKWLKFKKGANYEYAGRTYKWVGLATLLKPYVYFYWLRDNSVKFSGIGTVVASAENSMVVNPSQLLVRAWNDYANMAGPFDCWNYEDTLYGFLYSNQADYPDWIYFTLVPYINDLGL